MGTQTELESQRIDKWLWVARFFKTRGLAADAVSGGKVHLDGQRVKPAKGVRPGARLEIRRGEQTFSVEVLGLHPQRRPASEAVLLYRETEESIAARAEVSAERAAIAQQRADRMGRPTKRDRRKISELKEQA